MSENTLTLSATALDYIGPQQVRITRQGDSAPELVAQYELMGTENADIQLLDWLDAQCFIAVCRDGSVYIADAEGKADGGYIHALEPTLKQNFGGDLGVCLDARRERLWMAGRMRLPGARGPHLISFNLPDLAEGPRLALDAMDELRFEYEMLTLRTDGKFALYARNDKGGYKFRDHQLLIIDPDAEQADWIALDSKPTPESVSVRRSQFLFKEPGWLVQSAANEVVAQGEGDERRFQAGITAINLNQPDASWRLPLRWLDPAKIDLDEDACDDLAALASGELSSQYNDSWQDFLNTLTGVWIDPNQPDHFWLAWLDGRLLKVTQDGQVISPLYKLGRLVNGEAKALFNDAEVVALLPAPAGELRLSIGEFEDARIWQAQLDQIQDDWLICSPYQPAALQLDAQRQAMPAASGRIEITTSDLESDAGQIAALQQLLRLMPAIGAQLAQQSQPRCYFAFSDSLGRQQSEAQFFPYAGHADSDNQNGSELSQAILNALLDWPLSTDQWQNLRANIDPEQPLDRKSVLGDLAICLADEAEALPLLARYFQHANTHLEQADPLHLNQTLPLIREQHDGSNELAEFLAAVPAPYNDSDARAEVRDPYDDW